MKRLSRSFRVYANLCLAVALLSIANCAGAASAKNYWHASGSQIVDANGDPVRISGINWYGFETVDGVVHGLSSQDYRTILKTIKSLGYNTVRLPFSNQMVEHPAVPSNIAYSNATGPINTPLKGLNSLQILDQVIAAAGANGLKVILDDHRSEAGNSTESNGLWYTGAYPESSWIADWKTLVNRYSGVVDGSGNPVLIGVDLRNEPHLSVNGSNTGACWTGDASVAGCPTSNTAQNWPAAAARAGNAILGINPNLLVFVEGVDCYNGDCDFWGGNLEGARNYPVPLSNSRQLVYSAHDYGPHEYQQSWFDAVTTSSSLNAVWTKFWGYLCISDVAPVWVGEFGTTNSAADAESSTPGSQGQWFSSLVSFLANHPALNWTYWALNGEDSYGLLDGNYDPTPPSSIKQQLLSSIEAGPGNKTAGCSAAPVRPAAPMVSSPTSSSLAVSWSAVAAPANCTVGYTLVRSMASNFPPAQTATLGTGLTSTTFADQNLSPSTTYYYEVLAADSYGSSAFSPSASGKTSSPVSSAGCHVTYSLINQWNTGFQANIVIANTGSQPLSSWALNFNFPGDQSINSLWNASYTQNGQAVTITNASYDGSIGAGGSSEGIGFTAAYSGTNGSPANFSVNGVACH